MGGLTRRDIIQAKGCELMFKVFSEFFALALSGLATFVMTPEVDFSKHVTNPSQMLQKSWLRTAETLNKVVENERRKLDRY